MTINDCADGGGRFASVGIGKSVKQKKTLHLSYGSGLKFQRLQFRNFPSKSIFFLLPDLETG
jgi:hypothetical protein